MAVGVALAVPPVRRGAADRLERLVATAAPHGLVEMSFRYAVLGQVAQEGLAEEFAPDGSVDPAARAGPDWPGSRAELGQTAPQRTRLASRRPPLGLVSRALCSLIL